MVNIPDVKLGLISVSRDCFPSALSENRRNEVYAQYKNRYGEIFNCKTVVENEIHMLRAVSEVEKQGVNALVVLLGNFGPEIPETLIAKHFKGPVMYVASAEENIAVLSSERGDALCGMLNCSYNLGIRNLKAYIPPYPIGTADEIADMINDFQCIARAILGINSLKIITFGPRPMDFIACNAPIKPLFDLGVEIEENSELDLYVSFKQHEGDKRIPEKIREMESELGDGNKMPEILPKLAQYELTLLDIADQHKGSCNYVAFANKCWPAFQTEFGFVPCYVNSRLTAMGIPVACEVDIYGALSEYIGTCISGETVTLLDINNNVPNEMYENEIAGKFDYEQDDTFMGFHCGNTSICRLEKASMTFHTIMKRTLEPDSEPNITRGTLEGDIIPGDITMYRLQGNARGELNAYVAQGEVLPIASRSFGGIGVFAVNEMRRFYRYVLIGKQYPHHAAVAFGKHGKALYSLFDYLGIEDISFNQRKGQLYKNENPFS